MQNCFRFTLEDLIIKTETTNYFGNYLATNLIFNADLRSTILALPAHCKLCDLNSILQRSTSVEFLSGRNSRFPLDPRPNSATISKTRPNERPTNILLNKLTNKQGKSEKWPPKNMGTDKQAAVSAVSDMRIKTLKSNRKYIANSQ